MSWTTRVCADLSDPDLREKLPARNEPYWMPLSANRALGFGKSGTGPLRWLARYKTVEGQYRRVALGTGAPDTGEAGFLHALELAKAIFAQPEISRQSADTHPLGRNRDLVYCPWGATYTVGHALEEYYSWIRIAASEGHQLGLLSRINRNLLPSLGTLPVAEFSFDVVRNYCLGFLARNDLRLKVKQTELSRDQIASRKRTLNMNLSALRAALKMAWEHGLIEERKTWLCIRFLKVQHQPRVLHLSRGECRRLVDACPADLRALVLAALYSGCRANELTALRVKDVARHGFGIFVERAKSYKPRFVFLCDEAMAFFLDHCRGKEDGDLVFRRKNAMSWNFAYQSGFKIAVAKAALPAKLTFHELRHTYASQLVQAGTPLPLVAKQLGHSDIATVAGTYGHFSPQISEAEIQARFSPLLGDGGDRIAKNRDVLDALRQSFHQSDWRAYGNSWGAVAHEPLIDLDWIAGDPERASALLRFRRVRDQARR